MSETTNPLPCPSPAELRAFAVGDLGDEDVDRIGGHVLGCEPCERALSSLDATADGLVRNLSGLDPDVPRFAPVPEALLRLARGAWQAPCGDARADVSLDSGRRL